MKTRAALTVAVLAVAALLAWAQLRAAEPEGPYRLLKEIPIGGQGGWDYLAVDPVNRRLYVSHATKVVVIDVDKDAVVGTIEPTPGVHGIAVADDLGRGFISNGGDAKAAIFDLKTLAVLSSVETGPNPDAILYEPGRQDVYAFNRRGQSATVFEAKTGKVVATIPLSGNPEFAQADPQAGRVYNNIDNKNEVDVIDTKTHTVAAKWPIAPGESASGMAIDVAHHRLFLGCENNLMAMLDSATGKVLATLPIGPGVDAAAFDPGTGLAFASSGGDGTITVARPDGDTLTLVQRLKTAPRARTMTLDPKTHKLYTATATIEPPAPGATGAAARGRVVPDTFKVLVYEMVK